MLTRRLILYFSTADSCGVAVSWLFNCDVIIVPKYLVDAASLPASSTIVENLFLLIDVKFDIAMLAGFTQAIHGLRPSGQRLRTVPKRSRRFGEPTTRLHFPRRQ